MQNNSGYKAPSPGRNRETARSEATKAHDRCAIADLHINHNMTTRQIARELGLSQSTVVKDLAHLKKEWVAESESIHAENLLESLRILDDAEQMYRQIYDYSVKHSEKPEVTDVGVPSKDGKVQTKKSIRTKRVKPYSIKAVDGLVKVAAKRAEITGVTKQAGVTVNMPTQPDPLAGLTYKERADKLVEILNAAAARARAKGIVLPPPTNSPGRFIEAGPDSGPALLPGGPQTPMSGQG